MMEALDRANPDEASGLYLRQHGFLFPAARKKLKEIYSSLSLELED